MAIGNKIKNRRIELNMSQEELAKKVGYKDKSAINKIELGINQVPEKRLKDFALALNTSITYLIGIIEDKDLNIVQEKLLNVIVSNYVYEFNEIYEMLVKALKRKPTAEELKDELLNLLSEDEFYRGIGIAVNNLPKKDKATVYKLIGFRMAK